MKIYLAGGMRATWQDRLILLCEPNVIFFDPRTHALTDPHDYTKWDLEHVAKADLLVAQMAEDNPSGLGLSVEMGYAAALAKTIIFIDEIQTDWRSRYFGMHRTIADYVVSSVAEAAAIIKAFK